MSGKAWYSTTRKNKLKPHVCRWSYPDPTTVKGYRQQEKSYTTQAEAYQAVFEMQARIDSGEFDAKQVTFGEAARHWLAFKDVKPATRREYKRLIDNVLTPYLDKPLRDVAMMRKELHTLIRENTNGRFIRTILEGTCNLAMAEGDLPNGHRLAMMDLPRRVTHVRELIPFTPEQLNAVVEAMPERYRLAVLLCRGCGLRIGEALALETDAIHDGYIEVKRAVINGVDGLPKMRYEGFVPRKVPVPYWLEPVIAEHVAKYAIDGVLFPSGVHYSGRLPSRSRYVYYTTVRKRLTVAAESAGLPTGHAGLNFTFHQLRKHYATQLRDEAKLLDITDGDIEQWLGHKNLTRDTYAFQGDDALDRGRKMSDPRVNQ